jgi:hypothetical protein
VGCRFNSWVGGLGVVVDKVFNYSCKIRNLVLFCPGLYHDATENVMFSEGFSDRIRQEKSYLKAARIFALLSKYKGNLFLVKGEIDNFIYY